MFSVHIYRRSRTGEKIYLNRDLKFQRLPEVFQLEGCDANPSKVIANGDPINIYHGGDVLNSSLKWIKKDQSNAQGLLRIFISGKSFELKDSIKYEDLLYVVVNSGGEEKVMKYIESGLLGTGNRMTLFPLEGCNEDDDSILVSLEKVGEYPQETDNHKYVTTREGWKRDRVVEKRPERYWSYVAIIIVALFLIVCALLSR